MQKPFKLLEERWCQINDKLNISQGTSLENYLTKYIKTLKKSVQKLSYNLYEKPKNNNAFSRSKAQYGCKRIISLLKILFLSVGEIVISSEWHDDDDGVWYWETQTHCEIYTWRCSHFYRRKKNQEGFCFHFPRACYNYILIYLEGNIAASFVKLILFIKELDLNDENHHRYFGLICSK